MNCVVNSITEAKEDMAADVGGLDLVQHIAGRDHQGAGVVPGAKFARNNF